jgi:uncharacterized protein (TIGR03792 family)
MSAADHHVIAALAVIDPPRPTLVAMIVEWLSFPVSRDELAEWLPVEEQAWSRFLEQQPGFVRKEMWVEEGDETTVHAIIWWNSRDDWKRITLDEVAEVDARMGDALRRSTERVYRVVRAC